MACCAYASYAIFSGTHLLNSNNFNNYDGKIETSWPKLFSSNHSIRRDDEVNWELRLNEPQVHCTMSVVGICATRWILTKSPRCDGINLYIVEYSKQRGVGQDPSYCGICNHHFEDPCDKMIEKLIMYLTRLGVNTPLYLSPYELTAHCTVCHQLMFPYFLYGSIYIFE